MTKEERRHTDKQDGSASEPSAEITAEDDTPLIPPANVEIAAEVDDILDKIDEETVPEPANSIESPDGSAPTNTQNHTAITDWHWHSSKWEARASRTTLNEQGGYNGSEDHPGYGTEPGPDFRYAEMASRCNRARYHLGAPEGSGVLLLTCRAVYFRVTLQSTN